MKHKKLNRKFMAKKFGKEYAEDSKKYDQRKMDSVYCHFGDLCSFSHYERTDKRKEVKKMKADLIELIECAQHNYENLLDERDYFHDMVLSMYKELEEAKKELKE